MSISRRSSTPDIDDLAFRVHSAILHMMRRIRREDEAGGLSAPRLSALSCVVFGRARTPSELAAMEQVSKPTMTNLVAALERDGFLRREASTMDRRVVFIHATPKARRTMERSRSRRAAFLADKFRGLPNNELAALDRSADVLMRIYEETR